MDAQGQVCLLRSHVGAASWVTTLLLLVGACGGSDGSGANVEIGPEVEPPIVTQDTDPPVVSLEIVVEPGPPVTRVGETVHLAGTVLADGVGVASAVVQVSSDRDGPLTSVLADGAGTFSLQLMSLSAGRHTITLEATDGSHEGVAVVELGMCDWPAAESFHTDLTGPGLTRFGSAYWDPGGWMELTGIDKDLRGSIWLTARKVDPGDFRLEFRVATGGGLGTGADGLALTVVDLPTVQDLAVYALGAGAGGCIGYGVAPEWCPTSTYGGGVNAFHIEFDTWYNWQQFPDPTEANHVAITLDGDPHAHALWAEYPLEDLLWHQVVVQTVDEDVSVQIDGQPVLQGRIPGFRFDGGWLGLSASTGASSNYHRCDDIRIMDRCVVPE